MKPNSSTTHKESKLAIEQLICQVLGLDNKTIKDVNIIIGTVLRHDNFHQHTILFIRVDLFTHEFGCYLHITDLDLYYTVVNYFSTNITDSYNYHIKIGDRNFKLWIKQGGPYNPKDVQISGMRFYGLFLV